MALSLLLSRYLFDTHLANNFAPIKSVFFLSERICCKCLVNFQTTIYVYQIISQR